MSGRLLVCTDLDRTLLPNGPEAESPGSREHFARLVARPEVIFAAVTGRDRGLVEEAMEDYGLPIPDFVIGDVGTTIYAVGPQRLWQHQQYWEREIAVDWRGLNSRDLQDRLRDIAVLRPQEKAKQNTFKLSYYAPPDADWDQLSLLIRERLESGKFHARLIWSIDEAENVGLLDVIPARAGKFHAIEALMQQQGFTEADTVFCGDSGNDLEVLESHLPSVLVANAAAQVREQALAGARRAGHEEQLYLSRGGFMGMNGCYAAGILEGIAHYHPAAIAWMGFAAERTAP